ncbi:MAG TPA: acyltransferase [Steroidobacteraceae bacterium]|nr:acyltransferase [Steroidobacteraceae bacterium]
MNYLTSLRGIAAVLVVLFHVKLLLADSAVARAVVPFLSHGYLAVDFFLVLSGFIMAYKYHDTFRDGVRARLFDFLAKRIARIFPLHAFVMLAYLAIPVTLHLTGREYDHAQFSVSQFFYKFLLIDLWTFDQVSWKSWNVPSWTISAELLAYLLFPLLMFRFQRLRPFVVPVILAAACLALALSYDERECAGLGDCIGHLGLFRCLIEFALGIGVYLAHRRTGGISARVFAAGTCVVLAAYVVLAVSPVPNYWYVPAMFAGLLYGLLGFSSFVHRFLEMRPLVFLGDISYSVYLTHVLIAEVMFRVFLAPGKMISASPWLIVSYVAVTLLISTVTYWLVEKPCRRRVYALLIGKRNPPAGVPAKEQSGARE